jgi:hypothetical protein
LLLAAGIRFIDDAVGTGRLSKDAPFQRETICVKAMLQPRDMTQLVWTGE